MEREHLPASNPREDEAFEGFAREFIDRHRPAAPAWAIGRILVATDFSPGSLNALGRAEALAGMLGGELILLHVERVPVAGSRMAEVTHAAAEAELARTTAGLRERGLAVRGLLRMGAADEQILIAAETERADLVVMGTHGRKGIAHAVLGSVAERVVRGAPCPVLTVGPRREPEAV